MHTALSHVFFIFSSHTMSSPSHSLKPRHTIGSKHHILVVAHVITLFGISPHIAKCCTFMGGSHFRLRVTYHFNVSKYVTVVPVLSLTGLSRLCGNYAPHRKRLRCTRHLICMLFGLPWQHDSLARYCHRLFIIYSTH